jgi:aspartate/methionine/tyrosine aminotransferase
MHLQSSARSAVPPFAVMSILQRVAELRAAGRDVLSLCAGEPSQGAPADVRARAAEIMSAPVALGYSEAFGLRAVRDQLARHYARWYDLEVDPAQIAVTTGSSGAFLLSFLAAFDAGERVALARPGYPAYRNILTSLGCAVIELDCGPQQRFQPTVDLLEAAAPLAGLVIASPANPTGTMLATGQMAETAAWCHDNGVRLISDEIYHGITYTGSRGECAWTYNRSSVVISSFSKFWGMTGWRLGWALVPDDLLRGFDALAGNYALCPPVPAQHAAVCAFTPAAYGEAEDAVATFATAREVLLTRLPELGWTGVAPADGAFYLYADLGDNLAGHPNSIAWCADLLETYGVAVTPGTDFDSIAGGRAVRLSLAAGRQVVAEAVERILEFQRG